MTKIILNGEEENCLEVNKIIEDSLKKEVLNFLEGKKEVEDSLGEEVGDSLGEEVGDSLEEEEEKENKDSSEEMIMIILMKLNSYNITLISKQLISYFIMLIII